MPQKTIKQSFSVEYSYSLLFTKGVFNSLNPLFKDVLQSFKTNSPHKLLFVLDDGFLHKNSGIITQIKAYCKEYHKTILLTEILTVPGGESCKEGRVQVDKVLDAINRNRICRQSFVVVIGGGAVIDMVGYAANIAHRGVKLIRIPTTVLSQNDAAVGVKNGINLFDKKNFAGTFSVPFAIINDEEFLKTLEQRDWIAGVAEAVKVALIKDRNFFLFLEEHAKAIRDRDMEVMNTVIHRCAELHMEHIAGGGDPFETGSSRPLDFGHWAAHKLEQMTHYGVRHGEAVAKGMALDICYAEKAGLISSDSKERILRVLENLGFNLSFPIDTDKELLQLLDGIQEFREHLGGILTITLLKKIGTKFDVHEIDIKEMKLALKSLNSRYKVKA